jgi:hypothetical protein
MQGPAFRYLANDGREPMRERVPITVKASRLAIVGVVVFGGIADFYRAREGVQTESNVNRYRYGGLLIRCRHFMSEFDRVQMLKAITFTAARLVILPSN